MSDLTTITYLSCESSSSVLKSYQLARSGSTSYQLDDFRPGGFRDFLDSLLQTDEAISFELRPSFPLLEAEHCHYNRAALLYVELSLCNKAKQDVLPKLDEEDAYFMAVLAFLHSDLQPLKLYPGRNEVSDTNYWLCLADYPEFFFETIQVEMYRRRHRRELALLPLAEEKLQLAMASRFFSPLGRPSFLTAAGERVTSSCFAKRSHQGETNAHISRATLKKELELALPGRTHATLAKVLNIPKLSPGQLCYVEPNLYLSTGLRKPDQTLKRYFETTAALVKAALENGFVIAGGFVNSLVNPSYRLTELTSKAITLDGDYYYNEEGSSTTGDYAPVLSENGKLIFNGRRIYREKNKHLVQNIVLLLEAYFYQRPDFGMNEETWSYLDAKRDLLEACDLAAGLKQYAEYIRVIDSKLYLLNFSYSPDMDLFYVGTGIPELATKGVMASVKSIESNEQAYSSYYQTENAISYQGYINKISFQIIKRVYSSVEELLAGFDLDAARVALVQTPGAEMKAVALSSYLNSVRYGVNLIVPSRQSETFNYRLLKYSRRGFLPCLPLRGPIPSQITAVPHTLGELVMYKCVTGYWVKKRSCDYTNQDMNYRKIHYPDSDMRQFGLSLETRMKLAITHQYSPLPSDLYFLACQLEKINYNRADQRSVSEMRAIIEDNRTKLAFFNWKELDPGTQYTGSFNPTRLNYLSGEEKKAFYRPAPTSLELISYHLPEALSKIVDSYLGTGLEEIYNETVEAIIRVLFIRRRAGYLVDNYNPVVNFLLALFPQQLVGLRSYPHLTKTDYKERRELIEIVDGLRKEHNVITKLGETAFSDQEDKKELYFGSEQVAFPPDLEDTERKSMTYAEAVHLATNHLFGMGHIAYDEDSAPDDGDIYIPELEDEGEEDEGEEDEGEEGEGEEGEGEEGEEEEGEEDGEDNLPSLV